MIGCNKCLSFFCPPTTVHINLITFNLCAFTAPFLFPIGPLPSVQPSFSHGNSFLSPSPFIYLKFPSNIFFAFLIQSSKFHYHFLSIILPYLFSNTFTCPTTVQHLHFPAFLVFFVSLPKSPANICTMSIKYLPLSDRTKAQAVSCRPLTTKAWVHF